jgi:TonB family protein
LCFFLSLVSFGQQPVYQHYEVDSAAVPRGGMSYLTMFLQANLRKPIQAESEGVGGRVLVKGVVEPDGHITEVALLKSLRPDLDREALRAFRLFNAWQPAIKGGLPVRQTVMVPVSFPKTEPFPYENGKRIYYFGTDMRATTDPVTAKYKQEISLDSLGLPNGDMVVYTQDRNKWTEDNRLPLLREKSTRSGKPTEKIGYRSNDKLWIYNVYELGADGTLLGVTSYDNGRETGYPSKYHENGLLAEAGRKDNDQTIVTSWYQNGQIRQVRLNEGSYLASESPAQVLAYWNVDGKQTVKDGTGTVDYTSTRTSYADSLRKTTYTEHGSYLNGRQHGKWTGRYEDGSYNYEEQYDKGKLQSGRMQKADKPPVNYTIREKQPEFPGGMSGLGSFLSRTLRYPDDAQKKGQQGQVFVSFVVCTDGTLCDYEVVKGVSSSVDQEALRVVKAMSGKWKPGALRGEPVRVKYNLPINFTLQ